MQTFDSSHYGKTGSQLSTKRSIKRSKEKSDLDLSPSELKRRMEEVEARFIKPRPMPELNGELGVTLFDIAQSLGVSHYDLKRRVDRSRELEYLQLFKYQTTTSVVVPATGPRSETYVLCVMAAQHIVAKYSNMAGRSYLDFLIRSKDGLKVSLEVLEETQECLKAARQELGEANKKIEMLTQPKITRRNNIEIKTVVAEKGDLFHDTIYRVEKELIKQPKKEDKDYEQHYLQKLSRITSGNIKSMLTALKKIKCDRKVLNKRVGQLLEVCNDVDNLINPNDQEKYNSLVKEIEREVEQVSEYMR